MSLCARKKNFLFCTLLSLQLLQSTANPLSVSLQLKEATNNNTILEKPWFKVYNESFKTYLNPEDSKSFEEPLSPSSQKHLISEGTTESELTSPRITTESFYPSEPFPNPYPRSTGQLVIIITLSFLVPATFMFMLFWRLHREKRYLNQAGALVYRETIIVPSYNFSNGSQDSSNGPNNAAYMHAMLYDTPPAYETAVTTASVISGKEKQVQESEAPPPPYTSIHV